MWAGQFSPFKASTFIYFFSILLIQQKLGSLAISAYTMYAFSINYLIIFYRLKSSQCEKLVHSIFT